LAHALTADPLRRPWISPPQGGPPPKHGKEFRFAKPDTRGRALALQRHRLPTGTAPPEQWPGTASTRLTTRSAWIDHTGDLPIIDGTLIRLQADRLPGGNAPLPLWLWSSKTGRTTVDVDVRWQAFLRWFELEHTFRLMKQRPRLRSPTRSVPCRGR
jgi:hypothetical protein